MGVSGSVPSRSRKLADRSAEADDSPSVKDEDIESNDGREEQKTKDIEPTATEENDEDDDEVNELPRFTEKEVDAMYSCSRSFRTIRAYVVAKAWNHQEVLPAPVLLFGSLAMYFADAFFIGFITTWSPTLWIAWGVEVVLLVLSIGILLFKQDVAGAFFQDDYDRTRLDTRCCGCCNRAGYVFRAYIKGRQIDYEKIDTSTWFFAGVASFLTFQVIDGLLDLTVDSHLIRALVYLGLFFVVILGLSSNRSIAVALLTTPIRPQGPRVAPPTTSAADEEKTAKSQLHRANHIQQGKEVHVQSHVPTAAPESMRIEIGERPSPTEVHPISMGMTPPEPSVSPSPATKSAKRPKKERGPDEESQRSNRNKNNNSRPKPSIKGSQPRHRDL